MKLISIFSNYITGELYIYTIDGFMPFDKYYLLLEPYEKKRLDTRICGFSDRNTTVILEDYSNSIQKFGTYSDNNNITILNPIIINMNISSAIKYSKKISLINLCKTFLLCCNRNKYKLSIDITDQICSYLLNDYICYLSLQI
tara:strand:- start:265 stop:693 length:429 start_codon:yes stop_codon:yes gene_type:complete